MTEAAPENWVTDGHRVTRGAGGPTVCMLGDPTQRSLFDDADADMHQLRDAQLIATAPRLAAALAECAKRLETCCHHSGTTAEYSHLAVKVYRRLLAEANGQRPPREGT